MTARAKTLKKRKSPLASFDRAARGPNIPPPEREGACLLVMRDILHTTEMASTRIVPLPEQPYFRLPSSPVIKAIYELFTAGRRLDRLEASKLALNRHTTLQAYETDGRTVLSCTNESGDFTLSVATDLLPQTLKAGRGIKRLFLFLLIHWNRQQDARTISIPLKELIKCGAFNDAAAAWKNITVAMPALLSLQIQGLQRHGTKKHAQITDATPLFEDWRIEKRTLEVMLHPSCNTDFLFEYFTSLPAFFFNLYSNTQDAAFHIFYMARMKQNVDALYRGKAFAVSFQALHAALCLPAIGETRNPQRDCIERILEAVEQLNEAGAKTGLSLTIESDLTAPAKTVLAASRVLVRITGALFESLHPVMERRRHEAERQKRINARTEKIIAQRIAKTADR